VCLGDILCYRIKLIHRDKFMITEKYFRIMIWRGRMVSPVSVIVILKD
jgi:hypothetical protein